jgi:glycine/serine hydroxymethyltransferase
VRFLSAKELNAKDIQKQIFPVYVGKCLSHKAAQNRVEILSQGRSKVADDAQQARKWLRQQSKDFCAVGFDALVKRWDKCINVGGGYVEK